MDERTAALIARNRELLAIAAEARATARAAVERAEEAVRNLMERVVERERRRANRPPRGKAVLIEVTCPGPSPPA